MHKLMQQAFGQVPGTADPLKPARWGPLAALVKVQGRLSLAYDCGYFPANASLSLHYCYAVSPLPHHRYVVDIVLQSFRATHTYIGF